MPTLYSDNAVMTKVKALYGKRLREEDYRALLQKKSVGEITAYLKRETAYRISLEEVREELVHRGQLENLIRRHTVNIYLSLMKYSYQDSVFLRLYIMQQEVRQILLVLRYLSSDSMDRYIVTFPAYLSKYLSFDLFELAGVRSWTDLLAALSHSDYGKLLYPFRPRSESAGIDIPACEHALLGHYYGKSLALVTGHCHGQTREHMLSILNIRAYVHNIQVIYRSKLYFRQEPDEIRKKLVDVKITGMIPYHMLNRLVEAENIPAMMKILRSKAVLRRYLPQEDSAGVDFELFSEQLRQDLCRRVFRFSITPVVVLLSYMTLLEIEADNLISIVEGTRYAVPPEEIRKLLVI